MSPPRLCLYYAPVSCAMVPYIALAEAGAAFDVRPVNLRLGEQHAVAFQQLNPKQAVPVLTVDGRPLTENVAIQLWIAEQFPAASLLPTSTWERLEAIAFLVWCASGIHPRLTPNALPKRYCDVPGTEDSVRRCAQNLLRGSYALADQRLADGRDWFFGQFTLADAYFYWCFRRGGQFGMDLGGFAHCAAHQRRMQDRPSVQRLLAFEAQTLEAFARAD